jgi:hypothetical protein
MRASAQRVDEALKITNFRPLHRRPALSRARDHLAGNKADRASGDQTSTKCSSRWAPEAEATTFGMRTRPATTSELHSPFLLHQPFLAIGAKPNTFLAMQAFRVGLFRALNAFGSLWGFHRLCLRLWRWRGRRWRLTKDGACQERAHYHNYKCLSHIRASHDRGSLTSFIFVDEHVVRCSR